MAAAPRYPQAYEYSERSAQSRGTMPRTRLRSGRARKQSGSTEGMPFADIGRAEPVDVSDSEIGSFRFRARRHLIADARNEDQALIAQMTLLVHRMHNFLIEKKWMRPIPRRPRPRPIET